MTTARGAKASGLSASVAFGGVPPSRASGLYAKVVYGGLPAKIARESVEAAEIVYAGAPTMRNSNLGAYVVYAGEPNNVPRQSQYGAYVVWSTAPPGAEARTRAWTFTLDGHPFYVLDLGAEGTFAYDISTQQWCRFITSGWEGWNFRAGVMWGADNRVVAGDTIYQVVWELKPELTIDEGFRDIEHAVTGGLMTRSRVYRAVEELRVAGSIGDVTSTESITMTLRFSDDNGKTWSDPFPLELTPDDFGAEVVWRSLGSFMAPGRVFELTDVGGMLRIDGVDAFIDDFDDESD